MGLNLFRQLRKVERRLLISPATISEVLKVYVSVTRNPIREKSGQFWGEFHQRLHAIVLAISTERKIPENEVLGLPPATPLEESAERLFIELQTWLAANNGQKYQK